MQFERCEAHEGDGPSLIVSPDTEMSNEMGDLLFFQTLFKMTSGRPSEGRHEKDNVNNFFEIPRFRPSLRLVG